MSAEQTPTGGAPPNVEDTVRDFWATRPRRPRQGRKIAGVAAGIGKRYGIDPVIVRVALVVTAVYGGAGVLLYLLGWLLLPEEDDETSAFESMIHRGRSSTGTVLTIGLCIALIPMSGWVFNGPFPGVVGLAIVLGLLFLLHRNRGHVPGAQGEPQPTGQPDTAATAGTEQATGQQRPPAWDPLGAAPFAWDLPEPGAPAERQPQPEPPRRRRSRAGLATVGVALLVGAACVAFAGSIDFLTPTHIAGLVLAVLGLGMVGAAFAGGGRGLIGLAVPLAVISIAATAVIGNNGRLAGVGDERAQPASLAELQPRYAKSAGDITLDLTELPNTGSGTTMIDLRLGSAKVKVPEDADVTLRCHAGLGDVQCLGRSQSGTDSVVTVQDNGADGPGGVRLDINVDVGTGDVEVDRG